MAGNKSYASATSTYAPLGVEQPHPSLALLDSTQPANRDALLSRHPHALDGMDGEIEHQQNEASIKSGSAKKTNGFEREHESDSKHEHGKDKEDKKPGYGFESTIKGHPAMEGREPPEKIGGQLVEPCQSLDVPLPLSAETLSAEILADMLVEFREWCDRGPSRQHCRDAGQAGRDSGRRMGQGAQQAERSAAALRLVGPGESPTPLIPVHSG